MPVCFNSPVYRVALLILLGAIGLTWYHRAVYFDDAWFAEQSYWLIQDGRVRSELFRGINGWEDRIYVFHKLFIYAGALVMRLTGVSAANSKLLSIGCGVVTGWLVWRYNRPGGPEQPWLALLLYVGCGTLIRYVSVNRPELQCTMLGFASYVALDRSNQRPPRLVAAGILAGMAALTHLNGLIYMGAGAGWLLVRLGWRPALWFSLISGLTLSLYGLDALADGHFDRMIAQFIHDPATQSNFGLRSKLLVMVNYHQLFFHSLNELTLSVLLLLCLFIFYRSIRLSEPIVLYLTLLTGLFWLLTKSNFDVYFLLFVPGFATFVASCVASYLPSRPVRQRQIGRGLLMTYYLLSFVGVGNVLRENVATPLAEPYNAQLARYMPKRHARIIAPIGFFFGQIANYQIRGLSYYAMLAGRIPLPLPHFFELAGREGVEYIVSDVPLNASYPIPLTAPARIGHYRRVYQDGRTSIYAHDKPPAPIR